MLIPQFSLRWLLALTTVCAVAFSIFGLALRGSPWAQGVSIAIVALAVVLLVHAFLFTLLWAFSVVVFGPFRTLGGSARSPFAHDPAAGRPTEPAAAADKEIPATPILLD
jgi:hypothetical protein